ncbi:methyl-accepting chemotaxis protein [Cellulomonas pakistanensis]|uniref:Methyl-accepting chemotaxis protein n=1 Tax=Cellulomonas pakistanensis TaxID=992287 RepID=A0A919P7Q1_9CELL|nr:methyl-accepting chemotaxis protein [Cellulomonas pakistanensis]GIG35616.1 methyl-accepting chemotaxis protein [Cellulomonas pakistanensis]
MPQRVVRLADEVGRVTGEKLQGIEQVARSTKMLALNALIESARVGEAGAGFAVVAREVGEIADRARALSEELSSELRPRIDELTVLGHELVGRVRGQRLADLALNVIELMDRNLYERSCDVRWWATDAALVEALTTGEGAAAQHAAERLGTILRSYTVYLDLWLADADGRVVARAGGDRGGRALGTDVGDEPWFRAAMVTRTGDDYAALDVAPHRELGALTATYATAVREGGRANGRPVGALGVFFDWERQAQAIVDGVRLAPDERESTRVLILDRSGLVLAASDRAGVLTERVHLRTGDRTTGAYDEDDRTVGFAATPGYETYEGLGWYGALVQRG